MIMRPARQAGIEWWRAGVETEQVIDKNKLIAVVALSAANSALMAWRGFKKDD